MTSSLLSEPICVDNFGLIFAGAQKNISAAGLTLVIIRRDLLGKNKKPIPSMMDYALQAEHHSLYATPPTFNCYLAAKMFKWVKEQGGVEAIYKMNCRKAEKLYDYIDTSPCYVAPVERSARSHVNVRFNLINPELESLFLAQAIERKLYGLQGHRLIGGCRASLYNAMPLSGVEALISFMQGFAEEYHR
jgi:phosphoserine aminotransferase